MSTNNNPAEVFSRPNQEARIHDFEHFMLWADTPNRPNFRARMTFGERNGAFRISVFPNLESGPKVMFVGMAPTIFLQFLDRFRAAIHAPEGTPPDKMVNFEKDPSAAETKGAPVAKVPRNTLIFGKDKDGIVCIGIKQPNVENIMFRITSNAWHHFFKPDGTQVSASEGSMAEALALAKALEIAMMPYIARIRPPYDKNAARNKASTEDAKPIGGGAAMSFSADDDLDYL